MTLVADFDADASGYQRALAASESVTRRFGGALGEVATTATGVALGTLAIGSAQDVANKAYEFGLASLSAYVDKDREHQQQLAGTSAMYREMQAEVGGLILGHGGLEMILGTVNGVMGVFRGAIRSADDESNAFVQGGLSHMISALQVANGLYATARIGLAGMRLGWAGAKLGATGLALGVVEFIEVMDTGFFRVIIGSQDLLQGWAANLARVAEGLGNDGLAGSLRQGVAEMEASNDRYRQQIAEREISGNIMQQIARNAVADYEAALLAFANASVDAHDGAVDFHRALEEVRAALNDGTVALNLRTEAVDGQASSVNKLTVAERQLEAALQQREQQRQQRMRQQEADALRQQQREKTERRARADELMRQAEAETARLAQLREARMGYARSVAESGTSIIASSDNAGQAAKRASADGLAAFARMGLARAGVLFATPGMQLAAGAMFAASTVALGVAKTFGAKASAAAGGTGGGGSGGGGTGSAAPTVNLTQSFVSNGGNGFDTRAIASAVQTAVERGLLTTQLATGR